MLEELQQSVGKANVTLYKTGNYRGDGNPFTGCLQIPCSFKYCELKSSCISTFRHFRSKYTSFCAINKYANNDSIIIWLEW